MQENRKFFFINGGSYGFTSVTEIKKEIPVVSSSLSYIKQTILKYHPDIYTHTHTQTGIQTSKGLQTCLENIRRKQDA